MLVAGIGVLMAQFWRCRTRYMQSRCHGIVWEARRLRLQGEVLPRPRLTTFSCSRCRSWMAPPRPLDQCSFDSLDDLPCSSLLFVFTRTLRNSMGVNSLTSMLGCSQACCIRPILPCEARLSMQLSCDYAYVRGTTVKRTGLWVNTHQKIGSIPKKRRGY